MLVMDSILRLFEPLFTLESILKAHFLLSRFGLWCDTEQIRKVGFLIKRKAFGITDSS